ncbi:MAG: hypothetical protein ABIK37_02225 [candidate division WOR-3 bacterium]
MPSDPAHSPTGAYGTGSTRSLADRLRTRRGVALVLALVCAATALIHLPTLWHGFVWDDHLLLTADRLSVRSGLSTFRSRFQWDAGYAPESAPARALRPAAAFSLWLDLRLGGGQPWLFHLTNLLLTCAGAVLVALVVWELVHSGIWAGLAGLLFAAHSSHVESVAFISARPGLLLGLFLGLVALALLRSIRKRNPAWWLLAVASFVLALLSSESAVPFLLLFALTPPLVQTRFNRWFWLPVLASLAAVWLLVPQPALLVGSAPATELHALSRLLNAANTFGSYLKMFVWPFDHRVFYPRDPLFSGLTPNTLYAVIFLISIPLLALRRRYRLVMWGYAWTIIALLTAIASSPAGTQVAERLLYVPSAGMLFVVVIALSRLVAGQERLRQVVAIGLGAFFIFNATDSLARARIWRDDRSLFSTMVREAPRAPVALAGLARAIAAAEPDSAIALYNHAILIDQGYVRAHVEIGQLYGRTGDTRRALHHLRLAEQLRPDSPGVLGNLSLAWLAAGQSDSALAKAELAIRREPVLPDSAFAAVACARVLARDSSNVPALYHQSLLLLTRGDTVSARALIQRVLDLRPDLRALRRLVERLN